MAIKTYGSVNGQSKELKTIYGSVNGQSKKLVKLYGSVNGVSKLIYDSYQPSDYGRVTYYSVFTNAEWRSNSSTNLTIDSIDAEQFYQYALSRNWILANGQTNIWFYMDGNNMMANAERRDGQWDYNIPAQQVFQQGGISITLSSTSGNLVLGDYVAGSVDTTSPQVTVDLLSNAEYQTLGNESSYGASYTIGGNSVPRAAVTGFEFGALNTTTPNYFLAYSPVTTVTLLDNSPLATIGAGFLADCASFNQNLDLSDVTSIDAYFLHQCTAFNSAVVLTSVATIGNYFMSSCGSFNQPIAIPSTTTSIGTYFLANCTSFNQNLTLPSTITSIRTYFMYRCNAMVGTLTMNCAATVASTSNYTLATNSTSAACYTTGIKLSGTYKNEWHTRFPDRTSSPYRKTIVA